MISFPPANLGGIPAIGCTLAFGTPFSAQLIARVGYDWVLIDMEHNPLSAREAGIMTHVVLSASGGRCAPLIRVPSHNVEWIKWALDCGAPGIVVPMVQSGAEVEQIVQHAIYPPRGSRSFGPTMAPFADPDTTATGAKYLAETSKNIALIPMIESAKGVEHAEEICSNDAITAIFVGPVDLRYSLGLTGPEGDETVYLSALNKIVNICRHLGKPVGVFAANGEACKKRAAEGFDFILVK